MQKIQNRGTLSNPCASMIGVSMTKLIHNSIIKLGLIHYYFKDFSKVLPNLQMKNENLFDFEFSCISISK
jgi:hypothetical protein